MKIDYQERYEALRDLLIASAELKIVDPLSHRWEMKITMFPSTFEKLTAKVFDEEFLTQCK